MQVHSAMHAPGNLQAIGFLLMYALGYMENYQDISVWLKHLYSALLKDETVRPIDSKTCVCVRAHAFTMCGL